jgi:hypothetical protein
MFNNRLSLDLSVYDITTTDLIFDVPVPAATGYSFFKENVGEVENKGVEIVLGGTPVQSENFSWNSSLFFSRNKNTLIELVDGLDYLTYNETNSGNLTLRAQVGGGIGDIYGTVWDSNDSGSKLVNANGIPIASTPDNYLGNAQPDWLGGWNNTFALNNISLSFLIDARIGGQLYSETSSYLDEIGVSERSLEYRESGVTLLDAINTETDARNTKAITAQEYWGAIAGIAENYIFDQTNIRLREVAFSYRFLGVESLGLDAVSLQLIGRNLFFLSKDAEDIDPESTLGTSLGAQGINSRNLPSIRSLGFNLTLNF